MKEKRTGRTSRKEPSDWKRVRSLSDRQIRRAVETDPDVRPTDAEFWKKARVVIPAVSKPSPSAWMRTCSHGYESKRDTKRESTPCCGAIWKQTCCRGDGIECATAQRGEQFSGVIKIVNNRVPQALINRVRPMRSWFQFRAQASKRLASSLKKAQTGQEACPTLLCKLLILCCGTGVPACPSRFRWPFSAAS